MKIENPKIGISPALGFIVLLGVIINFLLRSWRSWGDPVVDFPQQLYLAWRVSQGDLLYRDLQHFYGPLSPLFNGMIFHWFGVSYLTLTITNILLACGLVFFLYRFLGKNFSWIAALVATITLASCHIFSDTSASSSFNFLAPYSHEATHGCILLLLLIASFSCPSKCKKREREFFQGILLGLLIVTKPEFILAGFAVSFLHAYWEIITIRKIQIPWSTLAGILFPLLLFFSYFFVFGAFSFIEAGKAVFGAIYPLVSGDIYDNPLYKDALGISELKQQILVIGKYLLWVFFFFVPAAAIDSIQNQKIYRFLRIGFLITASIFLFFQPSRELSRAWPQLSILGIVGLLYLQQRKLVEEKQFKIALYLGLCGIILSAKMFFHAGFFWMGFFLLLPSTLFLAMLFIEIIPSAMNRIRPQTSTLRWCGAIFFLVISYDVSTLSFQHYDKKQISIGEGKDQFFVYEKIIAPEIASGRLLKEIIHRTDGLMPKEATLLAIPEGTLVNYLSRRKNSTPYINNFLAKTLYNSFGGESEILATLKRSPPDYVLYLHRGMEYDDPVYKIRGKDGFANGSLDWIDTQYTEVDRIGPKSDDFSKLIYVLLKRNSL